MLPIALPLWVKRASFGYGASLAVVNPPTSSTRPTLVLRCRLRLSSALSSASPSWAARLRLRLPLRLAQISYCSSFRGSWCRALPNFFFLVNFTCCPALEVRQATRESWRRLSKGSSQMSEEAFCLNDGINTYLGNLPSSQISLLIQISQRKTPQQAPIRPPATTTTTIT